MRKVGRLRSTLDAAQVSDDLDESIPQPITDPAHAAVEVLLARMLGTQDLANSPPGQDGVVTVIVVPTTDWTDVTLETWRQVVRGGQRHINAYSGIEWHNGNWVGLAADSQPVGRDMSQAAETFATRIAQGLHCVGIAHEPTWLPADLVFGADHSLTLPALTGADVGAIAERLCGGDATQVVSDDLAVRLTPRLLRLARRPRQAADDYVGKLIILLERDQAAEKAVQPQSRQTIRIAPTLDRMHGMEEAVAWGRSVERDLAAYAAGKLAWSDVDRGCLLSGPPGCGKTMFAKALATTCGLPLITGSYGQWLGTGSGHQGDLLRSMQSAFKSAKAKAPSILFVDEIDSFGNRETVTHYPEWHREVVNALLVQVDGVDDREGVVVIGACNHPEKLDAALTRSGRLDRHIRIDLPDRQALAAILHEHLGAEADGWDLTQATLLADGSSGADCERFVRSARRRARAAGRSMVIDDLLVELDGMPETAADFRLAAVHEAGHATVAALLLPGFVSSVSLRSRADRGGNVHARTAANYVTADTLFRRVVVALAGRAAEEVLLGAPSSGAGGPAQSDLGVATGFAAMAAGAFGFDADLGIAWRGMPEPRSLAEVMFVPGVEVSVSRLLGRAYTEALTLVVEHREGLEAVIHELLCRRVLDGGEVQAIVDRHCRQVAA